MTCTACPQWKIRAERAEATVEELRARLRSIQGEIEAPDVILWRCPADGCRSYTYGPEWICPRHSLDAIPVRMRQAPTSTPSQESGE
jgi:hypothetical protein